MFEIMKSYGSTFQKHWWKDLFKIVFRIFDNMKLPDQMAEVSQVTSQMMSHVTVTHCHVMANQFFPHLYQDDTRKCYLAI